MKTVLVVDDDDTFARLLTAGLNRRGFTADHAPDTAQALALARETMPEWVVLDLHLKRGAGAPESGLALIAQLLALDPFTRIVVLTGYASVATAVEAIKLGAVHYLAKPAVLEEILAAFEKTDGDSTVAIDAGKLSILEVERDHILQTLTRNHNNISATARELRMHRRTLQRKLDKII